jgi:hypothetical protein
MSFQLLALACRVLFYLLMLFVAGCQVSVVKALNIDFRVSLVVVVSWFSGVGC